MDPIEEKLYAQAGQEVSSRTMSPGLMAKALADAEGDERKAAALYIRMRVEQLRSEYAKRVAAEAVREKQRKKLEDEDSKRKEAAKHTRCPKCGYIGKMTFSFINLIIADSNCKCPMCNHSFSWYYFKG